MEWGQFIEIRQCVARPEFQNIGECGTCIIDLLSYCHIYPFVHGDSSSQLYSNPHYSVNVAKTVPQAQEDKRDDCHLRTCCSGQLRGAPPSPNHVARVQKVP